ncbi:MULTISPECIES: TetR/AcrR family transcriptional regulator [unclassified Nocardiopsis]|uniref:TetR/AcrR family transcriptional regulator n=1 Tax=Nocardiopsis TaxID=2013 RepID=UPI00387AA789
MSSTDASDLTTRARIRDAAVTCFARQGFGATVRAIADHAGVSPGLVIHHFGSKAGLREACDEQVARSISDLEGGDTGDSGALLAMLAEVDGYADLFGYTMRTFQDGGPLAHRLYERLVTTTEEHFARGVEQGAYLPSRDPRGRARFAVSTALGSVLVFIALRGRGTDEDYGEMLRDWTAQFMLPSLELYTEGILADSAMLDAYLHHTGGAEDGPDTDPTHHS